MAHTATHVPLAIAIVYHAPPMDDVIGVGGFARVIKRGECAVKVVFPEFRNQADREFHLLRRLVGGAHIIRVLGLRHFPDRAEITMQDGGRCLLDLIPLPKRVRRPLFAQLVAAVDFMHARDVVHLDLKADNLVVDATATLRVIDFNLAHLLVTQADREGEQCTAWVGSPAYCLPEILASRPFNAVDADHWSVGVNAFAMWYGRLPWHRANPATDMAYSTILRRTTDDGLAPYDAIAAYYDLHSESPPAWLRDVVNRTLVHDPQARRAMRALPLLHNEARAVEEREILSSPLV
jgi:serine/threonine protein kinase